VNGTVVAYKFLRSGAVGPFSGFRWPRPAGDRPGEWVEGGGTAGVCDDGIHACEARHLPLWIWEELWAVELDGPLQPGRAKLRARRGRLLHRVDRWSPVSARAFADACAGRAEEHVAAPGGAATAAGMAADGRAAAAAAANSEDPYVTARGAAVCAYIAATTALRVAGHAAYRAERAWQAEWLLSTADGPESGLLGRFQARRRDSV